MNRKKKWRNAFSVAVSLVMVLVLSISGVSAETLAAPTVESAEESSQTETGPVQTEEETTTLSPETDEEQSESEQTESETQKETETVSETEETKGTKQTETDAETVTVEGTEEEEETETEEVIVNANGFVPRECAPNKSNSDDYEHYWNNNYPQGPNYPINNCTKYAYGRAYELLGYRPNNNGWGDAGSWYFGKDGYERSSNVNEPRLGAIICWSSGEYGHVAVVEKIEGEWVTFSDSSWPFIGKDGKKNPGWTFRLNTRKISQIAGYSGGFQGYIYLPGIPKPDPPKPTKPTIHPTNKLGNDFYAYIRYAVNATYLESEYGGTNVQTGGRMLAYTYYDPRMIWHFQRARDDKFGVSYTISNAYGVLDALGGGQNGSYDEAKDVGVYYKNNLHDNQRWYIDDIGGSNFRFVPVYSYEDENKPAFFLDAATASETDKGVKVRNIHVCTEAGGDWSFAQQFSIDIIENYVEPKTDYGDDFYASLNFGSNFNTFIETREKSENGKTFDNVQLSAATQLEPRNIWHFIKDNSGKSEFNNTYKIVNEYNGKCLNVEGGNWVNGTNITTLEDNASYAQRFYIIRSKNGSNFRLMPVHCYSRNDISIPKGLVMDIDAGSQKAGTNVLLWARDEDSGHTQTIDIQKLTSYKKPSAPLAPVSIGASGNRYGTRISWSAVDTNGDFDSRAYELNIYTGNSAVGKPYMSVCAESTSEYFSIDKLPKGIYTVTVKSVNTKYKDLVSLPITKTIKVGEAVELGFANKGDQILQDGKIELTAVYNENDTRNVKFVAAAYTATGKMQDSVILSQKLESGDNKIAVSIASLTNSHHIKIFCLDQNTLAPLADNLVYSKNLSASEWVRASEAPAGASILDEKWTYTETKTETTTSTNPALDGWTRTGSTLQQTGTGTHTYADYPGGFKADHALYNAYSKSALTANETDTTKRTVSAAAWKTYIYYHWTYNQSQLPNENYNVFVEDHYCWSNGREYYNFRAFESGTDYGHIDPNGRNGSECFYAWNNDPADGSWWWYRFPVYQQTYIDYKKLFTYEKKTTTERESATVVEESDNISNVVHWVKYQFYN